MEANVQWKYNIGKHKNAFVWALDTAKQSQFLERFSVLFGDEREKASIKASINIIFSVDDTLLE